MTLSSPLHGWLALDKAAGQGSTPALGAARRLFSDLAGQKLKAGHAGTLDPFAEGVLPIAFGEATKTIPFVQDRIKTYRFTVRWGVATDTDDLTGKPIAESQNRPDEPAIRAALPAFTGLISQRPPIYSALHVDGQRAYDLARQGTIPDLAPRQIEIMKLQLIEMHDENSATLEMICGKGTYVRALARDLGEALGTRAHVTRLIRTRVGPFAQKDAFSLEKLRDLAHKGELAKALLALDHPLDDIPGIGLTDELAFRLRQGRVISCHDTDPVAQDKTLALARLTGTKLAVALVERRGDEWQPVRVFNL